MTDHPTADPPSPPSPPPTDPADWYRRQQERERTAEAALARLSRRYSNARLAVFLLLVGSLAAIVLTASRLSPLWPAAAALLLVAFVVLVRRHDRVIRRQRDHAAAAELAEQGLARLARRWDELDLPPLPPVERLLAVRFDERLLAGRFEAAGATLADRRVPADRASASNATTAATTARDLDLLGKSSLYHLLAGPLTPPGRITLARWFLIPAAPPEVARRQQAAAELAGEPEERRRLALAARRLGGAEPDPEPFLAWAEGEPWLAPRPALLWTARLLALLSTGGLVAALAGLIPFSLWGLVAVANFVFAGSCVEPINRVFNAVSAREGAFASYAEALQVAAGGAAAGSAESLREIAAALTTDGGRPAHAWMRRLHNLVVLSDTRHSLIHFLLTILLLWDFHILHRLERWQRQAGGLARGWLAGLGRYEALAACGRLAFDHPDWCWPRIDPAADRLSADQLGHPLLPPAAMVANDVEVGPGGRFLLITGSNMSGKSTLLRALGINAVLAQAGAPACAERLELPPLELGTSVLVEDSLASGLSFFMAELKRIQAIVQQAEALAPGDDDGDEPADGERGPRRLFFLLDEALRGTNVGERRQALTRVILHLVDRGAFGAVSTHDLELAAVPRLAERCRVVHFRETVHPPRPGEEDDGSGGRPVMTFDYQLREGIATTTNALQLLELVGISTE